MPDATVETIPSGLYIDAWIAGERNSARAGIDLAPDDFVLLYIGRIDPVKGVDILIEAVRNLSASLPRLKVLALGSLSGSYSERDHITPYARSMIERAQGLPFRFIGFINNTTEQFCNYVSAADAVVVPSREEPQGLVVLESLAMGKSWLRIALR